MNGILLSISFPAQNIYLNFTLYSIHWSARILHIFSAISDRFEPKKQENTPIFKGEYYKFNLVVKSH